MGFFQTYFNNAREVGAVLGAILGVVFAGMSLLAFAGAVLLAIVTGTALALDRIKKGGA